MTDLEVADASLLWNLLRVFQAVRMSKCQCAKADELRREVIAAYTKLKDAEESPELVVERFRAYSYLLKLNQKLESHLGRCAICRDFRTSTRKPRVPGTPRTMR